MIRSLKTGRLYSRRQLGRKMRGIKGKSWTKFFNEKTKLVQDDTSGLTYGGYLEFSSRTHGLRGYTTEAKLKSHRKAANKHIGIGIKGRGRGKYAKPLVFDLIPGKKTKLKRTFAGKGKGNSTLQVFMRDKSGSGLSRPTGPSVAAQMRSERNRNIKRMTLRRMEQMYEKEFVQGIRFKFNQIVKRNGKKSA